jgi:protein-disulfide isomerase
VKGSSEVKIFSAILVVAIILVGFAVYPMLKKEPGPPEQGVTTPPPNIRKRLADTPGHVRGNPKAPYTLVVFSDFQCPVCKVGIASEEKALKEHKDTLKIVYHHYRAKPTHALSEFLTKAAESAGEQGKFWEMHDALFKNQDRIVADEDKDRVNKYVSDIARGMGLDMAKFKAALDDPHGQKVWDTDRDLAIDVDVVGTPCFLFVPPGGDIKKLPTVDHMEKWLADKTHWQ